MESKLILYFFTHSLLSNNEHKKQKQENEWKGFSKILYFCLILKSRTRNEKAGISRVILYSSLIFEIRTQETKTRNKGGGIEYFSTSLLFE